MKFSPETITELKAKHGDCLSHLAVETPDGKTAEFIIIPPSRKVADLVGRYSLDKDVAAANKVLIANCIVAGDNEAFEKNGGVYGEVLNQIRKQMAIKETKVKKL